MNLLHFSQEFVAINLRISICLLHKVRKEGLEGGHISYGNSQRTAIGVQISPSLRGRISINRPFNFLGFVFSDGMQTLAPQFTIVEFLNKIIWLMMRLNTIASRNKRNTLFLRQVLAQCFWPSLFEKHFKVMRIVHTCEY